METIKLDLIPGKKMPSLHASQYDDGREHGIDLFENGVVYKLDGTETLTINERKGDDCICSLDIENTFADSNHIVFTSTEQMCAVWGNNICELVIAKGEKTIGTLNFILEVEQSPTEGGIESESEIKNLERQIEAITEEVIGDDYYTAEETDEAIATAIEGKADKTYVDTELDKKADKNNTYTKTEVDTLIDNLPEPMIFKGTLGVGGTIQSLPTASASNEGFTYKVITDGTYAGQTAKVGDMFTSNGSDWVLIPSGDDDNDTWRAIKVNGVEVLGNGISSGAVDFVGSENIEVEFDGNGNKVGVKTKNIYTKEEVDDIVYNILPDDTASGSVANFETDLALPIKSLEIDVNAKQDLHGYDYPWVAGGGKNLFDKDNAPSIFGYIGSTSYKSNNMNARSTYIKINPNTTYTVQKTISARFTIAVAENIPTDGELFTTRYQRNDAQSITITSGANDNYLWIFYYLSTEETLTEEQIRNTIQIEVGSTATSWTPYENICPIEGWSAITLDVNGDTEVINLGGTYYGGHFTQDKAGHRQFAVDRKLKTIDGSTGVTVASSTYIKSDACDGYINDDDIQPRTGPEYQPDLLCNRLTQAKGNIWSNVGHPDEFCISNRSIHLNISNTALGIVDYTQETTATAKTKIDTFLQNDPVVVVIPITPYVVNLPDGEPIATLIGTNNIYADTGDTEVVFKCSVNDYINAHSGGNLLGMGGVYLGGAKSGGSEEEPTEESEEPKEVIKTLGDEPISKK